MADEEVAAEIPEEPTEVPEPTCDPMEPHDCAETTFAIIKVSCQGNTL